MMDMVDDGPLSGGGSIVSLTSLTSLMTPPWAAPPQNARRAFMRHPRPKTPYKRVYLVTTAGRDNLEREILSDLDEPDLNLVVALGMSFINANFSGQITRAGALLIEWAWLRGLEFTYREKRLMAHAHWEIWQQQGLSAELYHLKRSCSLFEEILELPAFIEEISVWTEYLRVLQALGTRKAAKVAKHIVHLADKNNEQDLAEYHFYCGCILKEYEKYPRASDHLFEAAELGPPRLFQPIEVMFIVARNVNEGDAKAKEKRGLHDSIHHDYSSVYQQFLCDALIPAHVTYEQWLADKKTWRLIAEKCSVHGMHGLAQDMLSQSLHFNEASYVDPKIWFRMAKLYFRSGRLPDALSCLAQATARDPGNRQYQTTRAIWLADANSFEYAINMSGIDELLNMLPHPHDLHVPAVNRLRVLHKIAVKKWDKALRDKEAERLAALALENYSGPSVDQDVQKRKVKDKSKKNPRILWRPPAPVVYPTKLTPKILSAIVKDIEGELEYKPTLHDDPLPAGTHRLFVEFVPKNTNKYNVVEQEVELVVEKATPFVHWNEPPFLYLGSKLTPKLHLNAEVLEEEGGGAFTTTTNNNNNNNTTSPSSKKSKQQSSSKMGNSKKGGGGGGGKKATTSSGDDEPASSRFVMVSRMGSESRVMGQPAGTYTYKLEGPQKLEIQPPGVSLEDIALPLGVHKLLVTFTPHDMLNYTKATAKTQVRIVPRIVPVVGWHTPEAITYRALLQPLQLNATCATTAGTFLYFFEITKSERRRKVFEVVDGGEKEELEEEEQRRRHEEEAEVEEDESNFEIVEWAEREKVNIGSLLNAGDNKLVCVFEPSDPVKYTNAEESVVLTVMRYQTTQVWTEPPCIYVGTPLDFREHLTARLVDDADGSGRGKFTYTCTIHECEPAADNTSKSINGPQHCDFDDTGVSSGVVSLIGLLPKGHHELHCTYTPLDGSNHIGSTISVPITVRCRPVIVWEKPEPIRYCMLISDTQCNASTPDCAGEFVYDPPLGTKLEIGHYMLKVVFVPEDPSVHDSSHAMVPLSVIRKLVPELTWTVTDIVYGEAVDEERVLCCSANVPGIFKYNVAPGQLLEAGCHSIITTFLPDDPVTYSCGSTVEQLIVLPQQIEISWDPLCLATGLMSISYGVPVTEHQLCALVTYPAPEDIPSLFGYMSYSVEEGDLLQSGIHIITATFTPSPRYARNYYPATVSVELEVRRFTPKLLWSRPPDMVFGVGALSQAHLNATVEMSTFSVAAVAGKVDDDDGDGNVVGGEWGAEHKSDYPLRRSEQKRVLIDGVYSYMPNFGEALPSAGRHTLRVVFTPKDSLNFGSCEKEVDIYVARGRPAISWTTPEPIYWGQVLSNRQLNATVSCPGLLATDGELVFVPGRGEVLPVGVHILKVEFVPFRLAVQNFDCKGCWAQVPLTVKPKAFNFESLDRLLLRKKHADMHEAMHETFHPVVTNHPVMPVKRASRQLFRPTSAPYATLHDRFRKEAWPSNPDDGSVGNSISISIGSTRRDDWRGKSVSMNSFLNTSYSPNESIVSNFNNSVDGGERRVSSANNLVGSPIKRGESRFPAMFDEDGLLVRPVTAGSRVMHAAVHTRRDNAVARPTRAAGSRTPPPTLQPEKERRTKSGSGVRSSGDSGKNRVKSS